MRIMNIKFQVVCWHVISTFDTCINKNLLRYSGYLDSLRGKNVLCLSMVKHGTSVEQLKDVRANCFCASLLRTKFTRDVMHRARALSNKVNNNRANSHHFDFAWI